jgi:hypothetical protein
MNHAYHKLKKQNKHTSKETNQKPETNIDYWIVSVGVADSRPLDLWSDNIDIGPLCLHQILKANDAPEMLLFLFRKVLYFCCPVIVSKKLLIGLSP